MSKTLEKGITLRCQNPGPGFVYLSLQNSLEAPGHKRGFPHSFNLSILNGLRPIKVSMLYFSVLSLLAAVLV